MTEGTTMTADAMKPCRYCGGQKRFQIVSPVSDHAWADCFCVKDRTTSLAAQDGLVEAVKRFMPTNINLANKNIDDREIIPLDVTFGELRAIAAALTSIEVKSS